MANTEDYLDGLLNSVSGVRQEVDETYNQIHEGRQKQLEYRNRISADDDFMEASGLSSYKPVQTKHTNLRQIFSEDEFLKSFEEELDSDDTDDFLREFERELDSSSKEPRSLMETIDRKVDEAREDIFNVDAWIPSKEDQEQLEATAREIESKAAEPEPELNAAMPELDVAMSEPEESVATEEPEPEEEPDLFFGSFVEPDAESFEDEADSVEISLGADFDDLKNPAVDPTDLSGFIDPDAEDSGADLMSLLSGNADLDDINALLSADLNEETLEETEAAFEAKVDELRADLDDAEQAAFAENSAKPAKEKKSFSPKQLIASFKEWLFTSVDDNGDVIAPKAKNISQENQNILDEMKGEGAPEAQKKKFALPFGKKKSADADGAEAKDEAKDNKDKKDKKEKKEKKEKPPKVKKPKKEDNSPKIPLKFIVGFVLIAASICVLVYLAQQLLGYSRIVSEAQDYYDEGSYLEAYESLLGLELRSSDEELYSQARLLASLERRLNEYNLFIRQEEYALALDSLLEGVDCFQEYYSDAEELGVASEFLAMGQQLTQLLHDQFGIDEEKAAELNSLNRENYSIQVNIILTELGMIEVDIDSYLEGEE